MKRIFATLPEYGGIQVIVFDPKPGVFPDNEPLESGSPLFRRAAQGAEMGIAAGGEINQKIYRDIYGVKTWDEKSFGRIYVHIINSKMFHEITSLEPPPTPVTARTYAELGLPWFELYDENKEDIASLPVITKIKSVKQMDKIKSFILQHDDASVDVPDVQIKKIKTKTDEVDDGSW